MSYAELAEFSCWLAVIGSQHKCQLNSIIFISFSPYDDTLSVRGTTVVNGKNRQEFPLSLYQPDCTLLCFLLRELNKNVLSGERSDLLRNKVFGFVSIYFCPRPFKTRMKTPCGCPGICHEPLKYSFCIRVSECNSFVFFCVFSIITLCFLG